jgi:hypothetical protein
MGATGLRLRQREWGIGWMVEFDRGGDEFDEYSDRSGRKDRWVTRIFELSKKSL